MNTLHKEIFYDRQFRVWIGVVKDEDGNQVFDCEYFYSKETAKAWKSEK